jgi:predicted ATPase
VSGYAGAGKTSFIEEVAQGVVIEGARFVSGKFSSMERSSPYSALSAHALACPTGARLGEQIDVFASRVRSILGGSVRVVGELFPELVSFARDLPIPETLDPSRSATALTACSPRP